MIQTGEIKEEVKDYSNKFSDKFTLRTYHSCSFYSSYDISKKTSSVNIFLYVSDKKEEIEKTAERIEIALSFDEDTELWEVFLKYRKKSEYGYFEVSSEDLPKKVVCHQNELLDEIKNGLLYLCYNPNLIEGILLSFSNAPTVLEYDPSNGLVKSFQTEFHKNIVEKITSVEKYSYGQYYNKYGYGYAGCHDYEDDKDDKDDWRDKTKSQSQSTSSSGIFNHGGGTQYKSTIKHNYKAKNDLNDKEQNWRKLAESYGKAWVDI